MFKINWVRLTKVWLALAVLTVFNCFDNFRCFGVLLRSDSFYHFIPFWQFCSFCGSCCHNDSFSNFDNFDSSQPFQITGVLRVWDVFPILNVLRILAALLVLETLPIFDSFRHVEIICSVIKPQKSKFVWSPFCFNIADTHRGSFSQVIFWSGIQRCFQIGWGVSTQTDTLVL